MRRIDLTPWVRRAMSVPVRQELEDAVPQGVTVFALRVRGTFEARITVPHHGTTRVFDDDADNLARQVMSVLRRILPAHST